MSGGTIWLSLAGQNNRILGLITGLLPLAAIFYGTGRFASEFGAATADVLGAAMQVLSIGAYLTVSLGAVMMVAAVIPAGTQLLSPHMNATQTNAHGAPQSRKERDCPWCGERVLESATICRFCDRGLVS